MKARVIAIESGKQFTDGKERVTLQIGDCDSTYSKLRFPRELLGTTVELDEGNRPRPQAGGNDSNGVRMPKGRNEESEMPTLGDMKYTFRNGEESSTNLTEAELHEQIIDIVKSNEECSFRWVNETYLITE